MLKRVVQTVQLPPWLEVFYTSAYYKLYMKRGVEKIHRFQAVIDLQKRLLTWKMWIKIELSKQLSMKITNSKCNRKSLLIFLPSSNRKNFVLPRKLVPISFMQATSPPSGARWIQFVPSYPSITFISSFHPRQVFQEFSSFQAFQLITYVFSVFSFLQQDWSRVVNKFLVSSAFRSRPASFIHLTKLLRFSLWCSNLRPINLHRPHILGTPRFRYEESIETYIKTNLYCVRMWTELMWLQKTKETASC
jgi:hypothetical protein